MTNKKTTKKALIASVISLLLCFTMLLGTTYAWFTDSVTSTNNIIKSGNLDVELYWSKDASTWNKVDANTNVFSNELWEPGHTEVVYLKVVNEGSLALKYQLGVNIAEELGSVNVYGDDFKLSDFILYGTIKGKINKFETREDALAKVTSAKKLNVAYANNSELYPVGTEGKASEEYVTFVVYMPETVGNEANHAKNVKAPTITLGINLFATQQMAENDSFGNDYDANAILPWDASVDTEWYDESKTEYVLYSAEELAGFAALVYGGDNMSGKTVKLGADINLGNLPWTPIGRMINTSGTAENSTFKGNFDGQGHTIYNLNVNTIDDVDDTNKGAGLFGAITGNVSNVNVVGAKIDTAHWAGVIAGSIEGSITNCSVDNVTINCLPESINGKWDNGDKAGAIVGYATNGTIENCTVGKATITGYRDLGAIAGASYNSVVASKVTGPVTIVKDSTHDYKGTSDDTTVNKMVGNLYGGATVAATGEENVTITTTTVFTVTNDAELATALASTDDSIVIELAADVSWKYPARSAYTGVNTKTVRINGNNKTLTLIQSDSDWSSIGLANAEGVLTLSDINVVKAAHNGNGAWNNHAINFTCDVVMNNVTFDNSVAVEADATLKNVKITDAKGDYYGLIVTAEGQTVTADGLYIESGRAVKVMEQYVASDALALVNITLSNASFKTNKKAAVLVTSTEGANITIGENVSLAGVKADPINAVWVDEDRETYFDLVTVIGGTKAKESEASKITYIFTADELIALGGQNLTDNYALANDIDMEGKELKSIGAAYGKSLSFNGNGYTVSNVTLVTGGQNGMTNVGMFYAFTNSTLGVANLTVKGMTVTEGVDENTIGAALIGYADGNSNVTLANVDVIDSSITNTLGNASALIGYTTGGNVIKLIDCDVKNCTIVGEKDTKQGAYAGTLNDNTTISVLNCSNETDRRDFGRTLGTVTGVTEVNATSNLKTIVSGANAGDTIILTEPVTVAGYAANTKLVITQPITIDLNGQILTTECGWGGIDAKGGCSIKNGTINHIGNTAAIKAFQVEAIENVVINVTETAGKVKGGIVIQEGANCYVGSIKNVTINGATNGIETYRCGARNDLAIGSMENVVINVTDTGIALSAPVGTVTNCTINGAKIGINAYLYGPYSVTIDLVESTVGGATAIYAHDEVGKTNPGSLTITYDEATVINGAITEEFETEVQDRVSVSQK